MNKKNKVSTSFSWVIFSGIVSLVLSGSNAWAAVSGTVYRDLPVNGGSLNTYGVKDANELGVEGITVTAYPGGMSTMTAADGTWSLGTTGDVRIEFSNIPSHLKASPDGGVGNASVQFVADGGTADFGVHNPSDFSDLNPDVLIPAQISGDPNGGGTAETQGTLVLHAYTASGTNSPATLNGAPTIINFGDLGSTYGAAWQRESKNYFTSAFAKRYVGFKSDPGSIFRVIDPAGASPTASEYFSLDALGFSTGAIAARGLPANAGQPAHDVDMFAQVGTVSLGDLELDATEENLFVVNLFDKKLYKINIGNPAKASITAGDVSSFTITDPGCTNGNWRPFGLGLDEIRNVMMVGGVCDAATGTTDDLHAYIYEFDLATASMGTTSVLDFSLNFQRLGVTTGYSGDANGAFINTHWNPWSDAPADWLLAVPPAAGNANRIHPEPALADIEVDVDGSLIIGFRDLWGDRWGAINYAPDTGDTGFYHTMSNGDVYRAQRNASGVFVFEDNGQFPGGPISPGAGNGDGPGGGEYYHQDAFASHSNVPKGGLAYLQGGSHFVAVAQDPLDVDSGGTKWMSVVPGGTPQDYQIYKSTWQDGTFYKANGLGDVELLFNAAPIEIGNRVWLDANGNGVQDADENGISGVEVKLLDNGGAEIASATTDVNGNYIFSNDPNGTSTTSHIYQLSSLQPNTAYTVQVQNVQGASKQGVLGSNQLTTANTGEGTQANANDSDGLLNGDHADAAVATSDIPTAGHNNHTYDFGFRDTPVGGTITIIKDATPDDPQDFAFTATGTGVANFTLDDDTDSTLSNSQHFTGLTDGAYSFTETTVADWTFTGISCSGAINSTITTNATGVDINLSGGENITCTFYNNNHTCPSGQILNQVVVTANEDESTYANNSDEACLELTSSEVDLALNKVVSPTSVNSGDTATYTLTVTNNGPGNATGVEVTDQLPTGVTYSSHNASQGTFTSGTGIWVVGDLANGVSATLSIEVSVD
jgi:uncharacterized repeat protein (TIGR01451 family)